MPGVSIAQRMSASNASSSSSDPGSGDLRRIAELPEVVRNQIAAGEVVERPASVVKELVENALDAGATEIKVELMEGGARLIRVSDDGSGIGPKDLTLAFTSHATSKLHEVTDLEHIASLGFRGEALASIGSVSRARITTRRAEDAEGFTIEDEGGKLSEVRAAGATLGTTVEVRDLFFNTPARRRFLKTTRTELGRCLDILQRLALAHVGVGFVVTHDRARVFDIEASMDLSGRVRRLFGKDLADALVPVDAADGTTRIQGLVAPPRLSRGDTSRQMWFLNGRSLRDKVLVSVLRQAHHGFQVERKHPVAFLSLSVDPGSVDVNVHPMKSEVRFRDERRLFGFLVKALREAVARTDMATPGERMLQRVERRGDWKPSYLPDPGALGASKNVPAAAPRELTPYELPSPGSNSSSAPIPTPAESLTRAVPAVAAGVEVTGWEAQDELSGPYVQVAKTYIIRALPDGFEIVDQHALHERLTFEGLKQQLAESRLEVQRYLVPQLVELSRSEVTLLSEHLPALTAIGIELEAFGDTTIAVQGLPALMRRPDPDEIVHDAVRLCSRGGPPPKAGDFLDDLLHSMACRSSVMAGDELDQDEIFSLLRHASEVAHDQTCPHGRPTRVRFRLSDLEKAFHRK